jgi:tetratricopeptide (TPR) repeat protein
MYGLALLRTGKFEMAAEVLSGALENMRSSHEERSLRRLVADLLLASGSLEEARGHYRKLADYFESRKGDDRWVADQLALLGGVDVNAREFPLYMDALKGYISFDGHHIPLGMRELVERMEEDFRESPLSDQARQMLGQLEDLIREWAAGRLDEVDVFVANNDYVQAKALLEQMLFDDLPGRVHDTVQQSMDNLLQGEMKYQEEQRAILAQTLSALWDRAVWLLDSQKYDEAIDVFEELLNTEYDIPARANIQKAAEAASVEMRRKSASIFVKARRERDYDRKKELLRESWQLLYDITAKYPEVKLIDKVRQNLLIIEKHIELFDPLVLQELKTVPGFEL